MTKLDLDEKERITLLKQVVRDSRKALTDLIRKEFNILEEIIDGKIRKS